MLSQNLKKTDDAAQLKEFMTQINVPHIKEGAVPPRSFRRSVVERLEKQKMAELEIDDESDSKRSCCKCKKLSKDSDANIVWRRMECKTQECFEEMLNASLTSSLNCIRGLKAISQSLSYWPDSDPDLDGLSVLGSYMWLLSFAVQHLIDDHANRKIAKLPEVSEIRQKFQEIAQSGEIFNELMSNFHQHTLRVRLDAVQTVKKMIKKWDLTSQSPLIKRPEQINHLCRPTKRRLGKGLSELTDETEVLQEPIFQLNWTPLTVMLRSNEIDWTQFSTLNPYEKIHWFTVFTQKALDIMELAAEDLTMVTGQISSINCGGGLDSTTTLKSHARELSSSMLYFAKSSPTPKKPSTAAKAKMLKSLSEYWFAVDVLHEESHTLLRLVHETRDIIRTCYVYMDVFYKWNLPSYDVFLTNANGNSRNKEKSKTIQEIRGVWGKFTSKESADRKLSDISEMLVMMDFSTSAYQRIVQVKPIEADGMFMKLDLHSLERRSVEFGLVSGIVDIRKSKGRLN